DYKDDDDHHHHHHHHGQPGNGSAFLLAPNGSHAPDHNVTQQRDEGGSGQPGNGSAFLLAPNGSHAPDHNVTQQRDEENLYFQGVDMAPNGTASSFCLDSTACKITITVVLAVLILITVAGNVVVCLAVGLNRRLRNLTNCFIVSLAITDLLLGLLVLPFSAIYQLSCKWSFGKVFCNIYTSLDVMLCTASILNLFMISLDRYCAVMDPLRYPVLVTPVRVAISLVLIWVISITLSFLSIHLGWNSRNETSKGNHTTSKCKVQVNEVYGLVDGLVTFYLPLLIMCITYYRIFKVARDQAKRINHISSWKAATIREHKATVTLAAVMGAFIICWFPYFTAFVYRGLRGDDAINEVLEAIVLWLGYANSALNPILYAALNRDFRTGYQQLFCCRLAHMGSSGGGGSGGGGSSGVFTLEDFVGDWEQTAAYNLDQVLEQGGVSSLLQNLAVSVTPIQRIVRSGENALKIDIHVIIPYEGLSADQMAQIEEVFKVVYPVDDHHFKVILPYGTLVIDGVTPNMLNYFGRPYEGIAVFDGKKITVTGTLWNGNKIIDERLITPDGSMLFRVTINS
uniref:Histamine H2 receptor n=1 Tax=Homo sapiens TaxID=9606 RepID=UPI003624ACD1